MIKIEKSEDILSTIDHEYEYETNDMKSEDFDLISKIEIEEDIVIKNRILRFIWIY